MEFSSVSLVIESKTFCNIDQYYLIGIGSLELPVFLILLGQRTSPEMISLCDRYWERIGHF